jgi:hypothetical protein
MIGSKGDDKIINRREEERVYKRATEVARAKRDQCTESVKLGFKQDHGRFMS